MFVTCNVFHIRAAHTNERRTPKHIVNVINYSFISQQQWTIGTITCTTMLLRWYIPFLGILKNFSNGVAEIYKFIVYINVIVGNF
jgi:hypothetical protein